MRSINTNKTNAGCLLNEDTQRMRRTQPRKFLLKVENQKLYRDIYNMYIINRSV